jgi:hypothetical protein
MGVRVDASGTPGHLPGAQVDPNAAPATPEELDRMIRYFRAMAQCSPPQGDMESWKAKSGALLQAALAVQKSPQDKAAVLALENAVECRQCHNPHKLSQN